MKFFANVGPSGRFIDVTGDDIAFNPDTENLASTTQPGFLRVLSGDPTQFLNGLGQFANPGSATIALTVDPPSPVENQVWFFTDNGVPATLFIVWFHGGQRYAFPIGSNVT